MHTEQLSIVIKALLGNLLDRYALNCIYEFNSVNLLDVILSSGSNISRSCGQTGFPNQLMSDSTPLFDEGSGASRVDERRGMGVLRAFPD